MRLKNKKKSIYILSMFKSDQIIKRKGNTIKRVKYWFTK